MQILFITQKVRFLIKDLFSKCEQIRRKLRICSHLLKKPLMGNFIFCALINVKMPPHFPCPCPQVSEIFPFSKFLENTERYSKLCQTCFAANYFGNTLLLRCSIGVWTRLSNVTIFRCAELTIISMNRRCHFYCHLTALVWCKISSSLRLGRTI